MIKKLSLKFVLVFLVLVVSVFITSACYAVELTSSQLNIVHLEDFGITMDDVYSYIQRYNTTDYNFPDDFSLGAFADYTSAGKIRFMFYATDYMFEYLVYDAPGSYRRIIGYDNTDTIVGNYHFATCTYDTNKSVFSDCRVGSLSTIAGPSNYSGTTGVLNVVDCTTFNIYLNGPNGELIYDPNYIDLSFDYSFEGITRGQTKLTIENLDSSLKMYGYVGLDTILSVGDTLDTIVNTSNLRLMSSKTDNSDLNCSLYEGEELLYYIVDENNVILDTGYISEMAKGDFLYGFEVYNGIDFVFLRDGQVYWDNTLTFKYAKGSSSQYIKNDVVSMAQSSYITTDKTVASDTCSGYVYDNSGNLIAQASCKYSNDLSSISISVDTSYFETNVGWNKSCYWLMSFDLDGTNVDGSDIDFSNYYVRWSVPTWLVLDSIEINGNEYLKFNGILGGFSSSGYSGLFNLKIYELIKDHKSNFDIKLEIYDFDDNLVLTHIINSDEIVANKIASEENNVNKGDYDILDNPNYTGDSVSPDINNIQNWTADDYLKLMSTDNFVWEFFKAILGNLPWWITTPLFILIFGVVLITLIRFARGA